MKKELKSANSYSYNKIISDFYLFNYHNMFKINGTINAKTEI